MLQKKVTILAALLVLLAAAAFAQVSVSGTVQYDLNTTISTVKDEDPDAVGESDILTNSNVIVGFAKDAISGRVIIRLAGVNNVPVSLASGLFDATAGWKINDLLALNVGYSWLPGSFFSGLGIDGDINAVLGASAVGRVPFLRLNIDGAYVGFWMPTFTQNKTPGFLVGYDYRASNFSAGVNLTGAYDTDPRIFGLVASLHGTASFGPAAVKLNLAIHKDGGEDEEKARVYAITGVTDLSRAGVGGDFNNKPFLEGLVEFDYTLGKATAVVTLAYGHNMDSGANTLQAGLAVPVQVVGGFRVIPGLIFKSTLADPVQGKDEVSSDNTLTTIKLGVSLAYSY